MIRKPFVQTSLSHLHLQRVAQVGEVGIEHAAVLGTSASVERRIDNLQLQQPDNLRIMMSRMRELMLRSLSATLVVHMI